MSYKRIITLVLFSLILMNFQCDEDDNLLLSPCDEAVVSDNSIYETLGSDFYTILRAEIEDDCLNLTISASGCDGSTWILDLLDSEDISESLPPQRYLKLKLINNETCLAVFEKAQSFDLAGLRIDGVTEVLLNIEDFSESLPYIY